MGLEGTFLSPEPAARIFVGASMGRRSRRLKAAVVRSSGEGWGIRCVQVDAMTAPVADRERIGNLAVKTLEQLLERCGLAARSIDGIGIAGFSGENVLAAQIADRIGITVASSFAETDAAAGGCGRPLGAVPDWILHRSLKLSRLILHLGAFFEAAWLPAGSAPRQTLAFDVGPGAELLDGLVSDLSQGRFPFDPSGHFAVQGRVSNNLLNKWLSQPFLLRLPPRRLSGGEFDAQFRQNSLQFAREQKISARDVLCTANHFVVRNLEQALRKLDLTLGERDEVWVSGGGVRNGFLWRLLQDALAPAPVFRSDEGMLPAEARGAVHAALLALLAMDNLTGNVPALTGARHERVLGQLTPGTPENWDRWVCNLADRFDIETRAAA